MLQETGLDTVDANRALGLPDDCREYTSVTNILADLGIKSIKLMVRSAIAPFLYACPLLCSHQVMHIVLPQGNACAPRQHIVLRHCLWLPPMCLYVCSNGTV